MLSDLFIRIRALFRREAVERELNDELRFHFERNAEKLMREGLTCPEAERQARLALGGIEQTKEECRHARGVAALDTLRQDSGYAFRVLRKSPGFTIAVVLSLALGIGANTAIFSLIDAVMWRMLPVKNPETLHSLVHGQSGPFENGFTFQQFRAFQQQGRCLAGIAAYARAPFSLVIDGQNEPTAEGQLVSGGYFGLLGVQPVMGRAIGPDDNAVAMLSHGYWKRRFAQDHAVIGRTIHISGMPFTVIGVTPPEFFGVEVGVAPDIFVSVTMQPTVMPSNENLLVDTVGLYATWLKVIARLVPGVSSDRAAAELNPVFRSQVPQGGKFQRLAGEKVAVAPAANGLTGLRRRFSQSLFLLMAVAGILLLIACANIANLLLARAAARQREFLLRLAIGAGRARLISQLLVESVMLAALGGVCGILFARCTTQFLASFLSVKLDLEPDVRMLAFTAAISVLTGILFGLAPALLATRTELIRARRGAKPGKMLAVVQVALSMVLLIVAGLFVRSLKYLTSQDTGEQNERVLVMRVEPKGSDQRNAHGVSARLDRIYRDLAARVEAIPGVHSASLAQFTPSSVKGVSGDVELDSGESLEAFVPMIYPRYFATAGIGLLAGRDFLESDLASTAPPVSVVNESFARRVFPNRNPIGQQYRIWGEPRAVVGVVKDSRYSDLHAASAPVVSYQPFLQTRTGRGQMALYVRAVGNPATILPRVREAVQRIDLSMPMFEVRTLAAEIDAVFVQERLLAMLSSLFAGLALLLACVGLYGLFAFMVVRRTREMAIRKAVGARGGDVVWSVMREVLLLVGVGITAGVPAGLLASRQVGGLLYGLTANDPITIAAAVAILVLVAAAAGYLPARTAARVDPMVALRVE